MAKKKTYDVFFTRNGYAEVEATSADEAMRIANEMSDWDISWDEDWNPVDVIPQQERSE